ncbi:patatin-like phospholipase/acyl hydrolase [Catenulispora sp. EB89]
MRKILSIDGGGIKGVFPAAFLAGVEESVEAPIGDYFDLIVGTSTGGIIAIGLGLGLSAQEILAFYETHGPKIFSGNRRINGLLQLGRAKYQREP